MHIYPQWLEKNEQTNKQTESLNRTVKVLNLLIYLSQLFLQEMFGDQSEEFLCGSWGSKVLIKVEGPLRGPDCKYRESADSCKISQFILFYLKDPFGELFSKMEIKSSIALCFFQKIQKFKLRRGGPQPPGKTMKNSATSLSPYATTR